MSWDLIPEIRHIVPGYLIPDTWRVVHGTWYLTPGTWHLGHGTWFLTPGTCAADTCVSNLPIGRLVINTITIVKGLLCMHEFNSCILKIDRQGICFSHLILCLILNFIFDYCSRAFPDLKSTVYIFADTR